MSTPDRYGFRLADPDRIDAALAVLRDPRRIRLTFEVADPGDGLGTRIEVTASENGRGQSVISVLLALKQAGIVVRDFEWLDVIDDLPESDLLRLVAEYQTVGSGLRPRSQMGRLGGQATLDIAVTRYLTITLSKTDSIRRERAPYDALIRDVAFNTPGCEPVLAQAAARLAATGDEDFRFAADSLLSAASQRSDLSAYTGDEVAYPEDALLSMVDDQYSPGPTALRLLGRTPSPLSAAVVTALCHAATLDEEFRTPAALQALRSAEALPEVRTAAEAALGSTDNEIRSDALMLLAHHWLDDARPIWREWLGSRSTTLRDMAEYLLVAHGVEEDLPDAAAQLAKIIRARPGGMTYSPPRGSGLIGLLARYPDSPIARAAFTDLAARWERFPDPDLRGWIREHYPWIEETSGTPAVTEAEDVEPEEPDIPDPPRISIDQGVVDIAFSETSAHTDARERFEALVEAHAAIEILGSDREWMSVRVVTDDPEGLIASLWNDAVIATS